MTFAPFEQLHGMLQCCGLQRRLRTRSYMVFSELGFQDQGNSRSALLITLLEETAIGRRRY